MAHETKIERRWGWTTRNTRQAEWRWTCACGDAGDWRARGGRRRADDGAAYHEYGNRAMTADELRTTGDGMNAGMTHAEATERAAAANTTNGWG